MHLRSDRVQPGSYEKDKETPKEDGDGSVENGVSDDSAKYHYRQDCESNVVLPSQQGLVSKQRLANEKRNRVQSKYRKKPAMVLVVMILQVEAFNFGEIGKRQYAQDV